MKEMSKAHAEMNLQEGQILVLIEASRKSAERFGHAFRKLREESGISLRKMAKRMKISAVYLSDIERGFRPPNKKLREKMMKLL